MSPVTHLLLGWTLATATPLERRDRAMVTLAGVAPDVDGLGAFAGYALLNPDLAQDWFAAYHHQIGHNLAFGLLLAVVATMVAQCRSRTFLLVLASFHLHLLGDLLGGRGPDGYPWPIPYWLPFSVGGEWVWSGQWKLNAWPNFVITAGLIAWALRVAWRNGRSPLELISLRANGVLVSTLRARFGSPQLECGRPGSRARDS